MGYHKIRRKLVTRDGTPIYKLKVYSQALTSVQVAAATVAEQTYTVTGLATTDRVLAVNPPASVVCGIVGARVSAANTLAIVWVNPTAAVATPVTGTYKIISVRE